MHRKRHHHLLDGKLNYIPGEARVILPYTGGNRASYKGENDPNIICTYE
jgi:hypothetical protein